EDSTSIRPRRAIIASLQILHLLAELLDHALELEADIGEIDVVRFGAQGVGLAVELLGEEVEPPADGAVLAEQMARLRHVSDAAIGSLGVVGLGGDEKGFRVQPVGIETLRGVEQLRALLGKPRLDSLGPAARRRLGLSRQGADLIEPRAEHAAERLTLV